jgi:hypothetical protein
MELLRGRPELLKERLAEQPALRNARMRTMRRNAALLEELPEAEMAEAVAEGALKVDAGELAETVNLLCAILNRVHENRPEFTQNMIWTFVSAADLPRISQTAAWLFEDFAQAARPVARAVLPSVLNALSDWLGPDEDGENGEMGEALARFRKTIAVTGGKGGSV